MASRTTIGLSAPALSDSLVESSFSEREKGGSSERRGKERGSSVDEKRGGG